MISFCFQPIPYYLSLITDIMTLLEVENLETQFRLGKETVRAVNRVSFSIAEGEVLGLVGESGCGKTVTSLSIMRLIESPGEIPGGESFG